MRRITGRRIVSGRIFRRRLCALMNPGSFARAVAGRRVSGVERRGKNILVHLNDASLWIHLRMTGDLRIAGPGGLRARTVSADLLLDDGRSLVLDDSRGLAVLRVVGARRLARLAASLGVDPLSAEFTAERLAEMARRSRAAIKTLLMDQRRVAGLGNIYAAEALYRARVDPRRRASGLGAERVGRLHAAIVAVLRRALRSTLCAYRRPGGFDEAEAFRPAVYDREGRPCRRCGRAIRRLRQAGRSTYFCAGCQW